MPPSILRHFLPLLVAAMTISCRPAYGAEVEAIIYKRAAGRELKLFIEKPAKWKAADRRPATASSIATPRSIRGSRKPSAKPTNFSARPAG